MNTTKLLTLPSLKDFQMKEAYVVIKKSFLEGYVYFSVLKNRRRLIFLKRKEALKVANFLNLVFMARIEVQKIIVLFSKKQNIVFLLSELESFLYWKASGKGYKPIDYENFLKEFNRLPVANKIKVYKE